MKWGRKLAPHIFYSVRRGHTTTHIYNTMADPELEEVSLSVSVIKTPKHLTYFQKDQTSPSCGAATTGRCPG